MDPATHKRFLEYRERYTYFGKELKMPPLDATAFSMADAEHRALEARASSRDDEEEARFWELGRLLFRD